VTSTSPRRQKWLTRPESNGKLGAMVFCFGGGIVNQLPCGSATIQRRRAVLRPPADAEDAKGSQRR
jgi:hypothetical protein